MPISSLPAIPAPVPGMGLCSVHPEHLPLPLLSMQPPEGCSASPVSEDNLYLWAATIFGPEVCSSPCSSS
jgi:hypothetical protein